MRLGFLLLTAILLASPTPGAAQSTTLTWLNCPTAAFGETSPLMAATFSCNGSYDYLLFGTLRLATPLSGVKGVTISLDMLDEDVSTLPAFWQYQLEGPYPQGCNYGTAFLSLNKRQSGGCAVYSSPWTAVVGSARTSLAFIPDGRNLNRGHFEGSIDTDTTVQLASNRDYYVFHIFFSTLRGTLCAGCSDRVTIVWGQTEIRFSDGSSMLLPSNPVGCATINGGSACEATPARRSTWGNLKLLYR